MRRPVRLRVVHVVPVVLVLVVVAIVLIARRPAAVAPVARVPDAGARPLPSVGDGDAPTEPQREVTLYFPSAGAIDVRATTATIPAAGAVSAEARSLVEALLAGPSEPGLVAPLPASTKLRALFLDARGTAFVDLSADAVRDAPGGSAWEMLAVKSLVNSLTKSFPEIRRVQVLVEGHAVETLAGHVDLTRPLAFDASAVFDE